MGKKKTAESGRDAEGKFSAGNAGGPGRPKGSKSLTMPLDRLMELAGDPETDDWFVRALLVRDSMAANGMDKVEEFFADQPEVLKRVREMKEVSDLARSVLLKRLQRELEE